MGDVFGGGKGGSGSSGYGQSRNSAQGLYNWGRPLAQVGYNMQQALQDLYFRPVQNMGVHGYRMETGLTRPFELQQVNNIPLSDVPLQFDVSQMPEYAGVRAAQVQPFQTAQQQIMGNLPRGGAQQQALANLEMQQATALDTGRANLNQQQRQMAENKNVLTWQMANDINRYNANRQFQADLMQRQFESDEINRAMQLMNASFAAGLPMLRGGADIGSQTGLAQANAQNAAKGAAGQGIGTMIGLGMLK